MLRNCFAFAVLGCSFALLGCGPSYVAVSGIVTLDGQPIEGAAVVFTSDDGTKTAVGMSDSTGNFTLSSDGKPGVVPGSYKVTVSKSAMVAGMSPAAAAEAGNADKDMIKSMIKGKGTTGGGKGGPPSATGPGPGGKAGAPLGGISKNEIPAIYALPNTSPLGQTVPSTGPVKIELKSKP